MTRFRNRSPYSPRISQPKKKNPAYGPITGSKTSSKKLSSPHPQSPSKESKNTGTPRSPSISSDSSGSPASPSADAIDSKHHKSSSQGTRSPSSPDRNVSEDLFGAGKGKTKSKIDLGVVTTRVRPSTGKSPRSPIRSPNRSPRSPTKVKSSSLPKLDTSILTMPIFYTESQYKAFNSFKATEYQILKEDRYAKEKHLYNEKQLEPTFLQLLLESQKDDNDLSGIQDRLKEMKILVKEVEKELKECKQKNTLYFNGPGMRSEKILPEILQNKQQLDFLRDLNAKCERLKSATTELKNRMQQVQEDSKINISKLDEGLIREMMLSRSLSLLPKIEKIVDLPKGDEIKVECRLHEYGRSTFNLTLTFDRMGGQLISVIIHRIENEKSINVTHKYHELVSYSIRKNDVEFLVGELNASIVA